MDIFLFSFNPPLSPFIKGGLRGIIKKRRLWSMKIFSITYTKISKNKMPWCPFGAESSEKVKWRKILLECQALGRVEKPKPECTPPLAGCGVYKKLDVVPNVCDDHEIYWSAKEELLCRSPWTFDLKTRFDKLTVLSEVEGQKSCLCVGRRFFLLAFFNRYVFFVSHAFGTNPKIK